MTPSGPVHRNWFSAAGRVTTVDDVFAWADLPSGIGDLVRDRGVVLGH